MLIAIDRVVEFPAGSPTIERLRLWESLAVDRRVARKPPIGRINFTIDPSSRASFPHLTESPIRSPFPAAAFLFIRAKGREKSPQPRRNKSPGCFPPG